MHLLRIDHFCSLEAFCSIPRGRDGDKISEWIKVLGHELLQTIKDKPARQLAMAHGIGMRYLMMSSYSPMHSCHVINMVQGAQIPSCQS